MLLRVAAVRLEGFPAPEVARTVHAAEVSGMGHNKRFGFHLWWRRHDEWTSVCLWRRHGQWSRLHLGDVQNERDESWFVGRYGCEGRIVRMESVVQMVDGNVYIYRLARHSPITGDSLAHFTRACGSGSIHQYARFLQCWESLMMATSAMGERIQRLLV